MLENGTYATNVELAEMWGLETRTAAEHLWYMHQDMSDSARERFFDASLWKGSYDDSVALLTSVLENDVREVIINETARFAEEYAQNRSLMRFHRYSPDKILAELNELTIPRREYRSEMAVIPEVKQFITSDIINEALARGNNMSGGKTRIYAYFRENHTAAEQAKFLKDEYGDSGSTLIIKRSSINSSSKGLTIQKRDCYDVQLKWNDAAKRVSELVRKDRYLIEQEDLRRNRQADESIVSIQAELERYIPIVREAVEQDTPYRNTCGHSDRENAEIECNAAVRRAVLASDDMELIKLFSDEPEFRQGLHQAVFDSTYSTLHELLRPLSQDDIDDALRLWNGDMESKRAVVRYMADHARDRDTAAWLANEYGSNSFIVRDGSPESLEMPWTKVQRRIAQLIQADNFYTEAERAAKESNESLSKHDPLAPPYQVGDTVYLENTAFEITEIGDYNVELCDPTQTYPIFRTESKESFERLIREDSRNGRITEYLSADLDTTDSDLQDVLVGEGGLLKDRDKDIISHWIRNGDGNTRISQKLYQFYAGTEDTMTLLIGEEADYRTNTMGLEIEMEDKFHTQLYFKWTEIAPVLRENTKGTLGYIGDISVRIDTKPYSWINFTINRELFEEYIRHDERNAHLFVPEAKEQEQPEIAVEPEVPTEEELDANPISVQIDGEWRTFPNRDAAEDAMFEEYKANLRRNAQNFHITYDNLGVGGAKTKYQANINAIKLLKHLEESDMQALPEQQEVLSRYVGWGGLADAFDETKENWKSEYSELKELLTPEEYEAARASTLNAHETFSGFCRKKCKTALPESQHHRRRL